MRPILHKLQLIMIASLLCWGCGKSNDSAVAVDAAGKHPASWLVSHGNSYLSDASSCKGCHGAALTGGISGVSCSSSSFNGLACHAGGPHPKPWPAHNVAPNQLSICIACHGAGLAGTSTAPACVKCHLQLLPGNVPLLGSCVSCHGNPPDGAIFPNISAAHNAHTLLSLACSSCHTGGGSGTATHGVALTVAFPAAYNAKNGTATLNQDGSCANISCHGGIATPQWRSGRIDSLADCVLCHVAGTAAGLPQANSYYSGEHQKHLVSIGLRCTDCHDMTVTAGSVSHFSGLGTPAFELAPAATMRVPLNFTSGVRSCSPGSSPPPGAFSIGVCHSAKNW